MLTKLPSLFISFFLSLFIAFIWPIFLLCDVIYYFCKKNEIFYCILGEETEVKDLNEYIKNMGYDNYTKEYYMKEEIKKLFKCSKCSWSSNNFLDFMNQNTNSEVDTTITPINSLEQGEIIAVHFTTANLKINYSIPCSASDIFSTVVQKLYEEYPDYKNKDCFFLCNGRVLDLNMNMKQNEIKTGNTIIVSMINDNDPLVQI